MAAIEHVVIFIQENRSFDHYFGSYRGVRGSLTERGAPLTPANTTSLPFDVRAAIPSRITLRTNSACTHDIAHDWVALHQSWNGGAMRFVTPRLLVDATGTALSMGYYTRARALHMPWRMPSRCAATCILSR